MSRVSLLSIVHRVSPSIVAMLVAFSCALPSHALIDCRADLDASRQVDGVDLCMLLDSWGSGTNDLDGDGIVTARDLTKLLSSWGPCAYTTQVVGRVVLPSGVGIGGAGVISDLGGLVASDSAGAFAFAVEYAWVTRSVTVTASAFIDGIEYVGSRTATPLVADGQTLVGDIVLGAACAPTFQPRFGALPGVNNAVGSLPDVRKSVVFDSGFGPEVVFWGRFDQAGAVPAPGGMAAFDGHRWRAFGSGVFNGNSVGTPDSQVAGAFAVVGGELYVGGSFNRLNAPSSAGGTAADGVARWDRVAQRWVALPSLPGSAIGTVQAMTSADFGGGAGEKLVVAFSSPNSPVFRLDGQSWTALGIPPIEVNAFAVRQESGGPRIYAVGSDGNVGGFDGAEWFAGTWSLLAMPSPTGSGVRGSVAVVGNQVIVGGISSGASPDSGLWIWDGLNWTPRDLPVSGTVNAIAAIEGGSSAGIYLGISSSTGATVCRLSGSTISEIAGSPNGSLNGSGVMTLASLAANGVPTLYAGGAIATAYGGTVSTLGVARYEAGAWHPVGSGINPSVRVAISRVEQGQVVHYMGGTFTSADGVALNGVARWDGTRFTPLGDGRANTSALCFHDAGDGSGELLYSAGSSSTSVARWNGTTWQEIGVPSTNGEVTALLSVTTPSGNRDLYVGGKFSTMGGVSATGVARWRNAKVWQPVGGGLGNANLTTNVRTLGFHTVAGVGSVYAAGDFGATDTGASKIARLDSMTDTWMPLGQGLSAPSNTFVAAMVSAGGKLYAGGRFSSIVGTNTDVRNIAVWDGTAWSPLQTTLGDVGLGNPGAPVGEGISALAWMDYGAGPRLIAAGNFSQTIGPAPRTMNSIARWNGSAWSAVDPSSSISGAISTLVTSSGAVQSNGIFIGGTFTNSGAGDSGIAEWGCE